jgi:Cell wall hydrolyses involved in spore germination
MAKHRKRSRYRQKKRQSERPTVRLALLLALLFLGIYFVVLAIGWLTPPASKDPRHFTMEEARKFNASIPFVEDPVSPAKRFFFRGSPAARLQAADCLATAALYEAGRSEAGQKAVMQVVLNRLRHPRFPKTVCGVVYQGAARRTGCQFTFTCDGSFKRRPVRSGWTTARKAARDALAGYVFLKIGTATHYHTDWIVPYWSGSLEKVAQVQDHIFYREPR